jgi:hypothetical protein
VNGPEIGYPEQYGCHVPGKKPKKRTKTDAPMAAVTVSLLLAGRLPESRIGPRTS